MANINKLTADTLESVTRIVKNTTPEATEIVLDNNRRITDDVIKKVSDAQSAVFKGGQKVADGHNSKKELNYFLQAGNEALREFKAEFPEIKSSSLLRAQANRLKAQGADEKTVFDLMELAHGYYHEIKRLRREVRSNSHDFESYIKALKIAAKEHGNLMNCQECSELMVYNFEQKGINASSIVLKGSGNFLSADPHGTTIIGLAKDADIHNPETWGENAVIVDAWAGICKPAQEAIKFYQQFFNIDLQNSTIKFLPLEDYRI